MQLLQWNKSNELKQILEEKDHKCHTKEIQKKKIFIFLVSKTTMKVSIAKVVSLEFLANIRIKIGKYIYIYTHTFCDQMKNN